MLSNFTKSAFFLLALFLGQKIASAGEIKTFTYKMGDFDVNIDYPIPFSKSKPEALQGENIELITWSFNPGWLFETKDGLLSFRIFKPDAVIDFRKTKNTFSGIYSTEDPEYFSKQVKTKSFVSKSGVEFEVLERYDYVVYFYNSNKVGLITFCFEFLDNRGRNGWSSMPESAWYSDAKKTMHKVMNSVRITEDIKIK